jgi:transketolase N-terminal domain/subunit
VCVYDAVLAIHHRRLSAVSTPTAPQSDEHAAGLGRAHDVLGCTGGSIGVGLPLAVGAAIACPDRRVTEPRLARSPVWPL